MVWKLNINSRLFDKNSSIITASSRLVAIHYESFLASELGVCLIKMEMRSSRRNLNAFSHFWYFA